ncbi:hypothetical protein [Novosphingobium beihaiensis]|uniref:Secreted protein with PEP-CTERM sorting signal n=1 Tax=Novosphingobium beihaiensis TaxID=2930389 RepID=A0ABT0BUM8_9SPHN|nr:hypothetical protein [Novosphingobium beihaiensis]MCJ2188732.1 hypothetical protein [Novosphingobium beihaiensis]
MNTFMAIMSQLFWGVTVGALSSTFSLLAKGTIVLGGLGGTAWYGLKRRRGSRKRKD